MRSSKPAEPVVTGLGVVSAVGLGKAAFLSGLMEGRHGFAVMSRPGRQKEGETAFLGAELPKLGKPAAVSPRLFRAASLAGRAALMVLQEAWDEADLRQLDPARIGLIIGGSNVQQRALHEVRRAYADRLHFLRPSYGVSYLDTDLCGLCTQQVGITGFAHTVGGASASGQLAILQAAEAVANGRVDACVAIGSLMDLSYWECAGFRALGAMGSDRFAADPSRACRPFDQDRDGFIFGEACAAVVLESAESARRRAVRPWAAVSGWGVAMDANRGPDPSRDGEVRAMEQALCRAGLTGADIDYVNPHGSGSRIGDRVELEALTACRLTGAWMNTTKSITGHGLTAAGAVEVVATLLKLRAGRLHPSRNLDVPIDLDRAWVREEPRELTINHALTLSLGFGGMNTALCLSRTSWE